MPTQSILTFVSNKSCPCTQNHYHLPFTSYSVSALWCGVKTMHVNKRDDYDGSAPLQFAIICLRIVRQIQLVSNEKKLCLKKLFFVSPFYC